MDNSIDKDKYINGFSSSSSSSSSSASIRHVSYSCGTCGYELNLSSSNRNTSTIGSKYGKSIKRGIISFFDIDESRFTQAEELRCIPYFSKNSWGFFRRRTKLLCRKCGYESKHRKYDVKIRALQPSSIERFRTPPYA